MNLAPAPRDEPVRGSLARVARDALAVAIGMWPLTAVVLMIFGLLVMAGVTGNPYGR